jgi:HAD superfamily hydrolase (TIGR01450 family)
VRARGVNLGDAKGFVFDVDGTLVHRAGDEVHVQPGAVEVFERIRASGRPLALFTNGSHEAPESFAAGLRAAGLEVADDELLTPLRSVQSYLRPGATVLLFATDPAREWLARAGMRLSEDGVDAVFVAHADRVDFERLEHAARAILAGAELLTASYAPAYAGANGPIFSRGAMTAAALSKATGREPVIVGKPSHAALQVIVEQTGARAEELVVVGDDVGMDIALGRLGGARTILCASGISGRVELADVPEAHRPDAVIGGVADLLELL